MNKFLRIVILIGIALNCSSCFWWFCGGGDDDDDAIKCIQAVVNKTDQCVILTIFGEYDTLVQQIGQGSKWYLRDRDCIFNDINPFVYLCSRQDSVVVCSENGTTLKVWRKSEQSEEERHFFNENSWYKQEWEEGGDMVYKFTFELKPEDIQP